MLKNFIVCCLAILACGCTADRNYTLKTNREQAGLRGDVKSALEFKRYMGAGGSGTDSSGARHAEINLKKYDAEGNALSQTYYYFDWFTPAAGDNKGEVGRDIPGFDYYEFSTDGIPQWEIVIDSLYDIRQLAVYEYDTEGGQGNKKLYALNYDRTETKYNYKNGRIVSENIQDLAGGRYDWIYKYKNGRLKEKSRDMVAANTREIWEYDNLERIKSMRIYNTAEEEDKLWYGTEYMYEGDNREQSETRTDMYQQDGSAMRGIVKFENGLPVSYELGNEGSGRYEYNEHGDIVFIMSTGPEGADTVRRDISYLWDGNGNWTEKNIASTNNDPMDNSLSQRIIIYYSDNR